MSRRRKLEKFADILRFPNVYEMTDINSSYVRANPSKTIDIKGNWKQKVFQNTNPICLELACGRGEYSLALARKYPNVNFIGIDVKGARIWKGASIALQEKLTNVAFLRIRIEQINNYFSTDEVDEVWITFPDPFHGKENRRTTSPNFLSLYKNMVRKGGKFHLKTDDDILYEYSVQTIREHPAYEIQYQCQDIYQGELYNQDLIFKTYYEIKHIAAGRSIKYLLFSYRS